MRFFQQRFQLIVQPYFVTPELVFCARHGPPETLFGMGHEAQGKLLRHQLLQQTFGIAKVFLAPPPPTIGQGLRQMECARHPARTFPLLTAWLPILLEHSPNRFPVLRSGFHDHFLHLLLNQPFRQQLQLLRVASVPASLELVFVFNFDVSHNHGQLLFMCIDSRYPISSFPPGDCSTPVPDIPGSE
jgi:hypothetical protein